MLIHWKIQVSTNNQWVCKVQFLICLFKLSSIIIKLSTIWSINCNNVFLPVLSSWSCSRRGATIYYNQLKTDQYQNNKVKYISAPDYSRFDFPANSMFTFDVCWGSLVTSIFGNSSSASNEFRLNVSSKFLAGFWIRVFFTP